MKTLLQALAVGTIVSLGMFGLGWLAVLAWPVLRIAQRLQKR